MHKIQSFSRYFKIDPGSQKLAQATFTCKAKSAMNSTSGMLMTYL